MKRVLLYAIPVACVLVWLAPTSDAQCSTCPTTTYYAPQTYQVCQPVVPQPVVVEQPRRCCLLRLCDWMWGRTPEPVYATAPAPAFQAVTYAPAATCAPTCCPPCSCTSCPTDCGTCPSCSGMPAPALSSRVGVPSTYASYNGTQFGSQTNVQQVNYSYSTPANSAATSTYGAGQSTPSYYNQSSLYSQPATTYQAPASRPQPSTNQPATYQAPAPKAVELVTPQDRTASNSYAPVQQAAYQAPLARATAKPTTVRPVAQSTSVSWTSGGW